MSSRQVGGWGREFTPGGGIERVARCPGRPGWHNDAVTRRLLALGAPLLVAALVLAGCGGSNKAASPSPSPSPTVATPSADVPAGVKLTDPGTELRFGQAATVPYQPNQRRSSVLRIKVTSVTRGTVNDLSSYVLDARTRASTPYFVRVNVTNVGKGDVGRTDIPLWAVNKANVLIHSSSFTNTFQRCPSRPFPTSFAPTDKLFQACLVYLIPNHGQLVSVSFRPLQAFAPIEWKGTIVVPHHATKKKTKKKKS